MSLRQLHAAARSTIGLLAAILLVLAASVVMAPAARAAAGDLDPSFGLAGKVTTDFAGNGDLASAVAIQPDGQIVLAGAALGTTQDFALARYKTDGSLDPAFGTGGKVRTDFAGGSDQAYGVVVQPDGRIVAAGGTGSVWELARYNPDGTLDVTFGIGGKVTTDFGLFPFEWAHAVVLQPDGKIVVAGTATPQPGPFDFAVARYNLNGTLDTTFGTGGKVTTDLAPPFGSTDFAYAAALQADGKIVVGGFSSGNGLDFALVRYTANGSLDGTFGSGGRVLTNLGGDQDEVHALALQPDGKIVAAGKSGNQCCLGSFSFALARYTTGGSLDSTFGTAGKVTTDFAGSHDAAHGVLVQPDGKILAVGESLPGGAVPGASFDFALVRYEPAGSLDPSFGTGGKVITDFPGRNDHAYAAALQADGKIVAAGDSFPDFALVRYFAAAPPAADLRVTQSDAPDPVLVGQGLTYTVTVTNNGPAAASGVTLTDTLPAGVAFVSATAGCGEVSGVVSCNLGGLASGAEATVTIAVTPQAAATIANQASASASETDPNPTDNTASEATTVNAAADLALTLSDAPDPVLLGQPLEYTLRATNHGPSAASGVTLTDTLPAGVTFRSATASQGSCSEAAGTVSCALGPLAMNGSATVTIEIRPGATGAITNAAGVSANEADPNPADNSASEATAVDPAADLAVALSDAPDPVLLGQTLAYKATVTNHGPSDAGGVTLTDTLPADASFLSASASQGGPCSHSGDTLTCPLGPLAAGAAATVDVRVTPTAVGKITNTAEASLVEVQTAKSDKPPGDPTPANDRASETTTVDPAADLALTLSDAPDPVVPGHALTYTATVTNNGPSDATGATLTNTPPVGAEVVSVGASQGSCSMTPGGALQCLLGAIPSGGAATVTLAVRPSEDGTIVTTATATANEADPNPADNQASETTTVYTPVADLGITIADSPDPVTLGDNLTYTLRATNQGPDRASGVVVSARLPADPFVSAIASQGSCAAQPDAARDLPCQLGELAPGASAIVTIVTTPSSTGLITASATVTASLPATDANPADNSASEQTTVRLVADLGITIADSPDPVTLGDNLTYTLRATNQGPDRASGVAVSARLPADPFVSASASQGSCAAQPDPTNTLSCQLGELAPGTSAVVTIVTTPSSTGLMTTSATVAASFPATDANPADNSASEQTTVRLVADLGITIADSPDPVPLGENLTYTLRATNQGPDRASGVVVSAHLPANPFVSASASQGTCAAQPDSARDLPCQLGVLAPGATATVTIVTTPSSTGLITTSAMVAASLPPTDANPADNSASEQTTVRLEADLGITIADSPDPVTLGNNLTYTLRATNHGPDRASGVVVSARLPADPFVSASASQGTCAAQPDAGRNLPCQLGELAPGASAIVTIVTTPSSAGMIATSATVTATLPPTDANPADNSASEQTTIVVSGQTGAANGKIAFASTRDGNSEIYSMKPDGTGQARLTTTTAIDAFPAWSPDGRKIAFVSNRGGNYDLYVMNADGSAQTRLTTNAATESHPAWSPDGAKIAFESNRDGNFEIYVMKADGSAQTRRTTNPALDIEPAWSPDGAKLAFESNRDGNFEIYVMNADGSAQTRRTTSPAIESHATWSPNGAKLAFESTRDGNFEIYAMKADGSAQTRLTTNPAIDGQPAWSPDGAKVAFTSTRDGNSELYVMNADGSAQTRLTTNPAIDAGPAWQRVG
jgi:uncharacterized delta-60 repeat protein/uncharacterized repeat protein (TIGR01451 family)